MRERLRTVSNALLLRCSAQKQKRQDFNSKGADVSHWSRRAKTIDESSVHLKFHYCCLAYIFTISTELLTKVVFQRDIYYRGIPVGKTGPSSFKEYASRPPYGPSCKYYNVLGRYC